jgi:pyruvyltransferase
MRRNIGVKLYWYRSKTPTGVNFGDDLSPLLVEILSARHIEHAPPHLADMAAIGSILHHIGRSFRRRRRRLTRLLQLRFSPIRIWGSGSFDEQNLPSQHFLDVLALRGDLSRDALGLPVGLPIGDPGLLADLVARRATTPKHAWGIVPHHFHVGLKEVKSLAENLPKSLVIDLSNPDVAGTVRAISSCDRVISSSLHGIVVADGLGIPNVWVTFPGEILGGAWKFHDYFSSVGRDFIEPLRLDSCPPPDARSFEDLATLAEPSSVEGARAALLESFSL